MNRRTDIQGLRALAVLMVVVFHAGIPLTGGFTGVDVFFVISGFVITAMLAREWAADGRINLRRFYLRRYLRLTPALAVLIAFVTAVSLVLLSPFGPQQTAAATGIGALLLVANFVIAHAAGDYFAVTAHQNPLLNTWSLSVEEQFYLFFPALIIGAWTLGRFLRRRSLVPLLVIGLVSLASLALSITWSNGVDLWPGLTSFFGGPEVFAFYGPLSRVWEFGAGCLLAVWVARGHAPSPRIAHTAGVLGALLVLGGAFLLTDSMVFPGWIAMVPVLGTALVIWSGCGAGSVVSRGLSWRPMVAIGDWSYSFYLWHWPLIVFAGMLFPGSGTIMIIAAFGSLLPAWLSYRFVEQPLRGLRPSTTWRTSGVIAVTSLTPILLAVGLVAGANTGWGGRFEQPVAAAAALAQGDGEITPSADQPAPGRPSTADEIPLAEADPTTVTKKTTSTDLRNLHVAVEAGCVNTDISPTTCRFGPPTGTTTTGTILMIGDSQAYALADGVIDAANSLGYDVVVSSRTGCPFLGRDSSGDHELPCRPWQKAALDYALTSQPAAVVIANRSAGYVHPEWDWRTAATDDGKRASSVKEAARLWRAGMTDVVSPLARAGIPVVIIGSVAEMPEFTDQRSLFAQTFGAKAYEVPLDKVVSDRKPAIEAERSALEAHPNATVFDPLPILCSDVCASAVDGVMLYQDETHLTVDGSRRLAPGLRSALQEVLRTSAPAS